MAESESFGKAFARARREGRKTFVWNGKTYGIKMKGEDAGDTKRTSTGGGVVIVIREKRRISVPVTSRMQDLDTCHAL